MTVRSENGPACELLLKWSLASMNGTRGTFVRSNTIERKCAEYQTVEVGVDFYKCV